jgi:electron transfer flavoprotein alpha subunit
MIVVAIDEASEASIFQVAGYGLVTDRFDAVPALTAALDITADKLPQT